MADVELVERRRGPYNTWEYTTAYYYYILYRALIDFGALLLKVYAYTADIPPAGGARL